MCVECPLIEMEPETLNRWVGKNAVGEHSLARKSRMPGEAKECLLKQIEQDKNPASGSRKLCWDLRIKSRKEGAGSQGGLRTLPCLLRWGTLHVIAANLNWICLRRRRLDKIGLAMSEVKSKYLQAVFASLSTCPLPQMWLAVTQSGTGIFLSLSGSSSRWLGSHYSEKQICFSRMRKNISW